MTSRDETYWEAVLQALQPWLAACDAAAAAGQRAPLWSPDAVYADKVRPGDCVVNPDAGWRGDEREVLDVMYVSGPDHEDMVTLSAPGGPPVRIAADWGLQRWTPELADLATVIVMDVARGTGERKADR
ncbi:MAG TPA: hypothetical protein VGM53_35240 [Streptosporangiaceae bacterium]|jgi:hypothetical protein